MSDVLSQIEAGFRAGALIPYLGPEVLNIGGAAPVPTSPEALVAALTKKVGVPGRIRNNLWSSAQYIESRRHRMILTRVMEGIFAPLVAPNTLHRHLAAMGLPLIVDCWYDSAMKTALRDALGSAWGQVQAVTRNNKFTYDMWYRWLHADDSEAKAVEAENWPTLLYKPHGAMSPNKEFLLSDSDYVEVLTEIDIQSPIPERVQALRTDRGFVFLGCRFSYQMDRIFARQIMKRSAGPHYAFITGDLTKNESRFLAEQNITRIDLPVAALLSEAAVS